MIMRVDENSPDGLAQGLAAKANSIITRIDLKATEIQTSGIDDCDLRKIKARLSLICHESQDRGRKVTAVTEWRIAAARRAYAHVQLVNSHLLLPVLVSVTPTDCSTPVFKEVLQMLPQRPRSTSYRLVLSPHMKTLLQKLAVDGGFAGSIRFQEIMESLFPEHSSVQQQQPRQIESLYTEVPIPDLPNFLQSLIPGVSSSESISQELMGGSTRSHCATILVPLLAKDCVCHFIIDRDVAMQCIDRYRLSSVEVM